MLLLLRQLWLLGLVGERSPGTSGEAGPPSARFAGLTTAAGPLSARLAGRLGLPGGVLGKRNRPTQWNPHGGSESAPALRARLDLDSEIPDGVLQGKELALEVVDLRQDLRIGQRMCLRRLLASRAGDGHGSGARLCSSGAWSDIPHSSISGRLCSSDAYCHGRRRGHEVPSRCLRRDGGADTNSDKEG